MSRLVRFTPALIGACLSLIPTGAGFAKGASSIQIVGPGLAEPVTVSGTQNSDSDNLWPLMVDSGFWQQICNRKCPSPTLRHAPAGELGPRYTITYRMDLGPKPRYVVQYVFPFAENGAVTYMPPGQRWYANRVDGGGWFVGRPRLMSVLMGFGVPPTASTPTLAPSSTTPVPAPHRSSSLWLVLITVVIIGTTLAATLLLVRSRRTQPATTEPSEGATESQHSPKVSV